jgi:hypothetical protein
MWRVVGPGIESTVHDTSQEARNRAEIHKGAIWYPIVVELDESQESA